LVDEWQGTGRGQHLALVIKVWNPLFSHKVAVPDAQVIKCIKVCIPLFSHKVAPGQALTLLYPTSLLSSIFQCPLGMPRCMHCHAADWNLKPISLVVSCYEYSENQLTFIPLFDWSVSDLEYCMPVAEYKGEV
jgi:hypothetical protein